MSAAQAAARHQRIVTFAGRVTPELRGTASIPDEAVVDAMRQIKRRVHKLQKEKQCHAPDASQAEPATGVIEL